MYTKLENLNIQFNNTQKEKFDKYIEFFTQYNNKVNLISKKEINLIFEKHIYDSLAFNLFLQKYKNCGQKILDMGTGGGFPSVPLALYYEEFEVTAADSINKKIRFISELKEELEIDNIYPLCQRAENFPPKMRGSFDIALSRAVAELAVILEYCIPYVKTGGYFIAYKSKKADEETQNAQNALKLLNTKLIDKIEYKLPIEADNTRMLLIFKKLKETPEKYPRANGTAKKIPL